ncbi:NACHT, LRR and PYD domains-containing protein 3-like [Megalops cyprinoides]|uniref:NACHT, LRR and PYD domains-containing protein 3-like n=1 Tax=Megalops cyprinoides TaxID=118141 RepID=UPI0018655767|nr:NACHT, LRR and PYD domains-containing protein 3-like [Megalops cyprinoides]
MGGTASEMSLSEEGEEGSDSEDSVYWDATDGVDGIESSHCKVRDEADHTPELQLSNDQVMDMSQENIMDLKSESNPLAKTGPEPRETNLSNQATAAGDPALELHHGNEGPPQTLGFGVGIQSKITAQSSNVVAPHIQSCTINQLTISTQNLAVQKPTESSAALLRSVRESIKSKLKKKFECIFEGIARQGKPTLFIDIYTELYIIEGGTGKINTEHEVRQIEIVSKKSDSQETKITCIDIFKPFGRKKHPIRTVLTKGIAGIGKTVSIQKFILDWAEEKANPDIELIFSLPFRELNLLKAEEFSLLGLLQHYHPELKEVEDINLDCSSIVFILDGLDECQLPLGFEKNIAWFDVRTSTTVDVLLTNLIMGNLLPSALLWVTTRPAAAKRIPAKSIHQVTEIRGFNDQQKEEYFQKRFNNPNLASTVIAHVKSSRSLYIMCHIPVFCWISATVLEHLLGEADCEEIPKTLTQMYTHFLLILININKQKYTETEETAVKTLTPSDKEIVLKLGELAFEGLEKGKLIFYEEDLRECDIDVSEASVYSGVFTEIFKEEYGLYQQKMFCFVHLSIQEYLAALFLFNRFTQREHPEEKETEEVESLYFSEEKDSLDVLMLQHYKEFVDEALKSENGHLDLCLRFLFGLLLDTSQCLLQGFLTHTGSKFNIMVKMVKHIKRKIRKKMSAERSINLFHCLNELNDNSLTEEIQFSLSSGNLSDEKLAPDQCSALAYLVLMSEDVLEVFDLKKYKTNEEGHKRLLPIVKSCTRAILHNSNLTAKHCRTLVSALRMANSHLRELDLSRNCLRYKGLLHLCVGLRSRCCRLQILNLSDNGLKDSSASDLCMMLRNPHSELRVLDLSNNDLGEDAIKPLSIVLKSPYCKLHSLILGNNKLEDSAMKYLCIGLTSPDCKLEVLDLGRNKVGEEGLKMLCSGLNSRHCKLRTLDLHCNNLGDEGVKLLCAELMSPSCKLQKLGLRECSLTALCCADLATVLRSHHSELGDLELRDNDLEDEGVRELSAGVQDPSCKLQRLGFVATKKSC